MSASSAIAEIQAKLPKQDLAFLMEHKIKKQAVMPAVCLLEMASAAGQVCDHKQHETLLFMFSVKKRQHNDNIEQELLEPATSKFASRN